MFGRIIGLGAFAALVGGAYLWLDVTSKRREVEPERLLLAKAKKDRDTVIAKVNAARAELEPQERAIADFDRLTAEKDSLAMRIAELEPERDALKTKFAEAVQAMRLKLIGTVLPELRLDDGRVLRNVKFQSITDAEVRLAHEGGTARVSTGMLPAELRDRLHIEASPQAAETTVVAAATPPPTPSTASTPPSADEPPAVAPVVLSMADQEKVEAATSALRSWEKKEIELRRTRNAYLAQVQDYRNKDDRARFLGKPQRYQKVIPQITSAINEIDNQLSQTTAKIVTLQMQVGDIKEGRVQ